MKYVRCNYLLIGAIVFTVICFIVKIAHAQCAHQQSICEIRSTLNKNNQGIIGVYAINSKNRQSTAYHYRHIFYATR